MSTLQPIKDLFMYLSVSENAVNAVLLKDQGVQQPVYYVSKTLVNAETRYLPLKEVGVSLSACHVEVAPLFSSLYRLRADRLSPVVLVKEI